MTVLDGTDEKLASRCNEYNFSVLFNFFHFEPKLVLSFRLLHRTASFAIVFIIKENHEIDQIQRGNSNQNDVMLNSSFSNRLIFNHRRETMQKL